MQLLSWQPKRMTNRIPIRPTSARKAPNRFRPQLEALEGRDLPSFAAPVAYGLNGPQALATADVNGDGKPDLISLVDGGGSIAVQLNNGKGGFGSATDHWSGSSGTDVFTALAVADLGGGKVAAVAAGYDEDDSFGAPGPISTLDDSFTAVETYDLIPNNAPISSLALADVFGNGTLAAVAASNIGQVFVIAFPDYVQTYDIPAQDTFPGPVQVAVGDFNGDGKPDIVVAGGSSVSVLLNNGNGTFGTAQTYAAGGSPTSVALGDFNRDGKLDLVTGNSNSTVSVLFGHGDGTFGTAQNYAIGGPATSVAVGDFNHDGFLDVATTGAEMDVLLNNGNGTFGAYQKVGPAGNNLVAADLSGDGFPGLAQIDANASPYVGSIDVVLNNADWMAGPVALSFGSITYNSKKHIYSETVTLTNNTSGTLTGPLSLELANLPSDVVLTDATGTTSGNPYLRFLTSSKALKPGASVSITLTFTAPSLSDITFGTEVVAL
jgi:hypothetical protein